ncbi:MAG: undecaprenyl-diphosphatase [Flavobacteriaceae bacterium]|jgi:undecaprenyl-diphosphatase
MIEYLESIDRAIVEAVNGWNTPFWDEFMWVVSGKQTWFPLYIALVFIAIKKGGWKMGILFLLFAAASVGLADLISSQIFKEMVQRYRPSHHALLTDKLHFYKIDADNYYMGGQYGFVSSHAANFFAVIVFSLLYLRDYKRWLSPVLIGCALLVCFSRLYLGVHYLSDLFVGAIVGSVLAYLVYRILFLTIAKKIQRQ